MKNSIACGLFRNTDASSNCEANQRLCFHNRDSTITLFSKSKISSFCACTAWLVSDLFKNHILVFLYVTFSEIFRLVEVRR